MKKNRALKDLIFYFLMILAVSCNNSGGKESQKLKEQDTLEIWADTGLAVVINEQRKAFENTYNNPFLDIRYAHESVIVERLMGNQLNCAVLQRNLNTNETNYLKEKEDFMPKQYTIAHDAFVLVVNNSNPLQELSVQAIGDYFRQPQHTVSPYQLVFENNRCQAIPFFQSYYHLTKEQISSAYAKSGLHDLMNFLRSDSRSVGIIPFSYIADIEASSTTDLLKDLKVLSIRYTDSMKMSHSINPSQASITTKEYPFTMPIVLLNCNMEKKSGTTFVNYIMKPRAQRLLLRCGLVPAIFPAREVRVNTK